GRVEWYRRPQAHERALGDRKTANAPVRYRNPLPEPRRAELLAGKQAVDDEPPRQAVVGLEQCAHRVEKARLRPGVQVEQDVFGRQQLGDLAHRCKGWIVARRLATGACSAQKTNRRTFRPAGANVRSDYSRFA